MVLIVTPAYIIGGGSDYFLIIVGYTENGYYNNWWKYYYSNTYVTSINPEKNIYSYKINSKINDIEFNLTYCDKTQENILITKYDRNINIDNKDLFYLDNNGNLYASKSGTASLKYYRDGIYGEVTINISDS